jgi:diamine N-acetyltransferase
MRAYYKEDGYPFVEAEARSALMQLVGDKRLGRVWVAPSDSRIVGYLAVTLGFSLEYRGRDAFIDELYIGSDSRGRGLGTEAIAIAEAFCRQRGANALHLEVEDHRTQALELYRRSGFEHHDRRLMTKLLTGSRT